MQLLTSQRLDAIRKDPHYAAYNAALIRAADAVLDRPIEVLSYRNHMYFYHSGMRDDRVKLLRRKSLTALVFAYLLTEDSRYLECAED